MHRNRERRNRGVIWAAGLSAAVTLALAEVARHAVSRTLPPTQKGFVPFLVFNVSLYLVAGILFTAGLLLIDSILPSRLSVRRLSSQFKNWLGGSEQDPRVRKVNAAVLGWLAGVGVFVFASYKGALFFMSSFHDKRLASMALAGYVVAVALLAVLAAMTAGHWLRKAFDLLSGTGAAFLASPRVLLGSVAVLSSAPGFYLAYRFRSAITSPEAAPVLFGLAYVVIFLLFLPVFSEARSAGWGRGRVAGFGWPLSLLLAISGTSYTFFHLGQDPMVTRLTNEETMLTGELVKAYQSAFDMDGDGYASILGGGDCDEWDPSVHPGAVDVPNNGVDEDCSGEDLRISYAGVEEEPPDGALPDELTGAGFSLGPEKTGAGKRQPGASASPDQGETPSRPDIVMITIDALRADHLGIAGYPRKLTPNIDRLAAQGAWFPRAYSQETSTAPSFGSMMTSKYPSEVEWGSKRYVPLLPSNLTIAEVLRSAGYDTAAVVTHSYFLPEYGYNQGFEHWDSSLVSRVNSIAFNKTTSPDVTRKAIEYLESTKDSAKPRFLWAHFFDPHDHYVFHKGFKKFGTKPLDRYDHEVLFTDHYVGKLLDYLASSERGRNTYVFVFADHGEAFGEHGYTLHGRHLFEDQIHVPLIMAGPSVPAGKTVSSPVGLIDVAATIAAISGAGRPGSFRGKDLRRFLLPSRPASREDNQVFSEFLGTRRRGPKKALISGKWKLIFDIKDRSYMLFDLSADPHEKNNLYAMEIGTARELRQRLARWMSTELKARWAMLSR